MDLCLRFDLLYHSHVHRYPPCRVELLLAWLRLSRPNLYHRLVRVHAYRLVGHRLRSIINGNRLSNQLRHLEKRCHGHVATLLAVFLLCDGSPQHLLDCQKIRESTGIMDLWAILEEIRKLLFWGLGRVWQLINWLYVTLVPYLGGPGAMFFVFAIFFFPAILIFAKSISGTQASIESFAKTTFSLALKIFAVFLVTMLILFVLSSF